MTSAKPAPRGTAYVASFETDEQCAHRIADLFAEDFAADQVAVSLVDAGRGNWGVTFYFRFPVDEWTVRDLAAVAGGIDTDVALTFERVAAKDWVRESLAGLQPVEAGRFIVHGAHDRARIPLNRIGIEIEASLAFGTGHHGTTRGCLLALDRLCKSRSNRRAAASKNVPRILDLGTGSGILAIAAARALRQRVLATDIDVSAVRVARANARLNRVGALVGVVKAERRHGAQRPRARTVRSCLRQHPAAAAASGLLRRSQNSPRPARASSFPGC